MSSVSLELIEGSSIDQSLSFFFNYSLTFYVFSGLEDSTMGSVADTVARVLRGCLENMPEADCIPKEQLSTSFQWVTKWVDYSNKYGFGYQLSDHTVGVLFNNGAHMSLLPDKK